jgi:hypothetical protein
MTGFPNFTKCISEFDTKIATVFNTLQIYIYGFNNQQLAKDKGWSSNGSAWG